MIKVVSMNTNDSFEYMYSKTCSLKPPQKVLSHMGVHENVSNVHKCIGFVAYVG